MSAPLPTVAAWTERLSSLDIPIFSSTADALELLRADEDNVDAHRIAEAMSNDPLMTLKILVHAASHQGSWVVTDAETVTEAPVMMEISSHRRSEAPDKSTGGAIGAPSPARLG